MAEQIEIQLGEHVIKVPAWATEETAKEMSKYNAASAKALTEMLRSTTRNNKIVNENQKLFKTMVTATQKDHTESIKAEKKLNAFREKHGKTLDKATKDIKKAGDNLLDAFNKDSLAGAAAAIAGVIGLGTVAGFAVSTLENFAKSITSLSNVGIGLGTSLVDLRQQASATGLGIDDYGKLVMANGDAIRAMGTSAQDGARRFSDLSIQTRVMARDFNNFGMSNTEFNEVLLEEIDIRRQSGMTQAEITKDVKNSMNGLLLETTALAAMTGQDRREMLRNRRELLDTSAAKAFRMALEKEGGMLSENFGNIATVLGAGGDVGKQLAMAIADSIATGVDIRAVAQGAFSQIASVNSDAAMAINDIANFARDNFETMDAADFNAVLTSKLAAIGDAVSAADLKQLGLLANQGNQGAESLISLIAEVHGLETSVKANRQAHDDAEEGLRVSAVLALPAAVQEVTNALKSSALTTVLGKLELDLDEAGDELVAALRKITDNFGVDTGLGEGLKNSWSELTTTSDKLKQALAGVAGVAFALSLTYGGRKLLGGAARGAGKVLGIGGGAAAGATAAGGTAAATTAGGKSLFRRLLSWSGKAIKTGGPVGVGLTAALTPTRAADATRTGRDDLPIATQEGLMAPVLARQAASAATEQQRVDAMSRRAEDLLMAQPVPTAASVRQLGSDAQAQSPEDKARITAMLERNGWFSEKSAEEVAETNRLLRRLIDAFQNQ